MGTIPLIVLGLLAAMVVLIGFGETSSSDRSGRRLTAKNECTNLVLAVFGYFDAYNHYPDIPLPPGGIPSTPALMNILLGLGSTGKTENPKQIRYYQGPEAKGSGGREYGGLLTTETTVELFDPWQKIEPGQDRHYHLLWDADGDDETIDPFTGKTLYNPILAWSSGKDGQYDLANPDAKVNKDNVYSWK